MKIEKAKSAGGKTYKPSEPFNSRVLKTYRITPEQPDEVRHMVLDLNGSNLKYLEGQSIGILPPGNQADGRPEKLRLYSIASSASGERGMPGTVSLCVKRLIEEENGKIYKGIASNYACDLKEGDSIRITGPVGMHFLLPEDDSVNIIMVATGTGIAPFRAFLDHIYLERKTPWKGKVILVFGCKFKNELLYFNDFSPDFKDLAGQSNFKLIQAISREDPPVNGQKAYVQTRIRENFTELNDLMKDGNFCFYICGLKGMEKGIENVFEEKLGNFQETKLAWKKEGKWIVEVY